MVEMKIRVNSPEHSEAIQLKLYRMGYNWIDAYNYDVEVKYNYGRFTHMPCLYLHNGFIRMSGYSEKAFAEDSAQEYLFENGEFVEKR